MPTYVGIDPGMDGALVMIREDGEVVCKDTPMLLVGKRRKYNLVAMREILDDISICEPGVAVGLEDVHAVPKFGIVTSGELMRGVGIWQGLTAGLPVTMVRPQAWKKMMMDGMPKEKDASRHRAMQLFPHAAGWFDLKKHHNRADALLIAEYLRRISH